jgi:hypothetical protein
MLYIRLAHAFKTMALDQFDNPAKTHSHIGWKSVNLVSNAGVEHFNDPRHLITLLHFCNEDDRNLFAASPLSQRDSAAFRPPKS